MAPAAAAGRAPVPGVNPTPNLPIGPRGRAGAGIVLRQPKEGKYELQVTGTERGEFDYVLQAFDRTGRQRWMHFGHSATEPGAVDRFEVTYSLSLDPPVWIVEKADHSHLSVHAWGDAGQDQDTVTRLLLTDPAGRRLGYSQLTGTTHTEIPRSVYDEGGGQTRPTLELEVSGPRAGAHTLEVVGTRAGRYDFEVHCTDGRGSDGVDDLQGIPTAPGVTHRYILECAPGRQPVLSLSGAFRGRLLSFASPLAASTRVSQVQTAFPVVVFYGAAILRESFEARLNRVDVGRSFHAKPGGREAVILQLGAGKNALVLSVRGRAAGGEIASARADFELDVR